MRTFRPHMLRLLRRLADEWDDLGEITIDKLEQMCSTLRRREQWPADEGIHTINLGKLRGCVKRPLLADKSGKLGKEDCLWQGLPIPRT